MSLRRVLLICALTVAAASNAQARRMQEPSHLLGVSGEQSYWTQADVRAMCEHQWSGQLNSQRNCEIHNKNKIGRPKNAADLQRLDAIQPELPDPPKKQKRTKAADEKAK